MPVGVAVVIDDPVDRTMQSHLLSTHINVELVHVVSIQSLWSPDVQFSDCTSAVNKRKGTSICHQIKKIINVDVSYSIHRI